MQTNRSWSIDDKRYNFQFGCEIGWEIKHGKRSAHGEEPVVLRHHDGVLEFARCHLFARRVDALGHTELRQRPAAAGDGHGPWRSAVALSKIKVGSAYKGS
jgi:hypothetical protein